MGQKPVVLSSSDRGGDHPPVLPLSHQPVNKDFSWVWHSFPWKGFPSVETERTVGVSEWINHPRQDNRTTWTLPKTGPRGGS